MSGFIENQWDEFTMRLLNTAQYLAAGNESLNREFRAQALKFGEENRPENYQQLLRLIAAGTQCAVGWREQVQGRQTDHDSLEQPGGGVSRNSQIAFAESENHESIPHPTESIAHQAEQARSNHG